MRASPVIAITAGDPCGVGPEVVLKALRSLRTARNAHLVVIGDHAVFRQAARRLRVRLPRWRIVRPAQRWQPTGPGTTFVDCAHRATFIPGRPTRAAGTAALAYLDCAIGLARACRIRALVTAPVTKWAIERVSRGFVGQTEYLARAFRRRDVAMMFVSDRLRVVLLTRHLALCDVPRAVNQRLLRATLRLTAEALQRHFRLRHPRLALCGLNPHAGEGGLFGQEERTVLLPVLRRLQLPGVICEGPFAADGLFANARGFDAIVCWYHDQGLIPFKMAARDQGCQLSVGLPIVRTSPDHGSALDIAGRGTANPGSMIYALNLAVQLTARQCSPPPN